MICNVCQTEITNIFSKNITQKISFRAGYTSKFGDGDSISLTVCDGCLFMMIGPYCQNKEAETEMKEIFQVGNLVIGEKEKIGEIKKIHPNRTTADVVWKDTTKNEIVWLRELTKKKAPSI